MKRCICIFLAAALLFSLAGCSLYDGEYLSVVPYEAEDTELTAEDGRISDAAGLERALLAMIAAHETEGKLLFGAYDGDISSDIAQTCWRVSTETALGAYCVDYISYDLSRIIAYYEAAVHIAYNRSREQVSGLISLRNSYAVRDCVQEAMENSQTYLALQVSTAFVDAATVQSYAEDIYYASANCLRCPVCSVNVYPDSGLERIFEITLDYGADETTAAEDMRRLNTRAQEIADSCGSGSGAETALALYQRLSADCEYLPEGGGLSDTAFGALCQGQADSKGFAMAYLTLCLCSGIDCSVVSGQYQKQEHWWNIVRLEGAYYHMDVSLSQMQGEAETCLCSDQNMSRDYWWDISAVPACEGMLSVEKILRPAPVEEEYAESSEIFP